MSSPMLISLLIAGLGTLAHGEPARFWSVMEGETASVRVDVEQERWKAPRSHVLLQLAPATENTFDGKATSATSLAVRKVAANVIQINPTLAPIVYMGSLGVMALGICWMFKDRGVGVCASIVCNVLALSTMSLLIRNIFVNAKFQFPEFVTATHAFVTALVGITTIVCRDGPSRAFAGFPDTRTWLRGILPVGIATGASLGLANLGLWYSNAHFYEMLGSSGFLVTAAVGVMLGRGFDWQLLPPMLMLTSGSMILSLGEMSFSGIGAVCILSACFCRASKAQIQAILMSPDSSLMQLGPVEMVTCTSLVSLVIMLVWSAAVEGLQPWQEILSMKAFVPVLLAAINASVLNIASIFVIRSLGPVAQQCVGQLKSVLCCVGAVAAFNEAITYQQIMGYSVVIGAVFWYNHRDMKLKESRKTQKATESTSLKPSRDVKV